MTRDVRHDLKNKSFDTHPGWEIMTISLVLRTMVVDKTLLRERLPTKTLWDRSQMVWGEYSEPVNYRNL